MIMRCTRKPALPARRSAGFTLLEVLVALAVIAIALAAIIHAAGSMAGNTVYLKQKVHAHWVAMNYMAELRRNKAWPLPSTQKKEVRFYGQDWQRITKFSANLPTPNIMRIDIAVLPAGGDEKYPLVSLTSFIANPQITTPPQTGGSPAAEP
jgi:general secretion pathway protein I